MIRLIIFAVLALTAAAQPAVGIQPKRANGAAAKLPVDHVNPLIGTSSSYSRWDFFASACRPSGMVNLSPDTKLTGEFWKSGYVYEEDKIFGFSHVHGWQLYGLSVLPVCGHPNAASGIKACASAFSHGDEVVKAGYHKVVLQRYGITAELTSTMRVGFHRYAFPKSDSSQILFFTGATLMGPITRSEVRKVSDTEVSGYAVMAPQLRRAKPFTVYFVAQFSKPFAKFGGWVDQKSLSGGVDVVSGANAGAYVNFATGAGEQVLMKVAISYGSVDGARRNLEAELPHWNFDQIVSESRADWNQWLSRIEVSGGTEDQRTRFYTDLWHSLLGRQVVSDADGSYCDMTGASPVIRKVRLDAKGKPLFPHYQWDSVWKSECTFPVLWALVYPEKVDGFCNTMVDIYRNGGLIPRGPSGGNYTYVMIGDSTPFFATAYSGGIRNYDVNLAYEGCRKNALPGGIRDHAGYEQGPNASAGGMKYYVERGYVPMGIKGSGFHQDGASMTLEYAYSDWCLAQMAKALGKNDDYQWLKRRSFNYTNLWDPTVKYMRPRNEDGSWLAKFSPVGPRGSFQTVGFCEANSAVYTYCVPHDMPGLIKLFGGNEEFSAALNRQFENAESWNFVVPHGEHGGAWIDYENEPSYALAHLFNFAGAPWLSQKWVRTIKERVYSDVTPEIGYIGDEDEGKSSSVSVLMAIGLFDVKGGAEINPSYQLTAPIFDQVTIHLSPDYFPGGSFTIKTSNSNDGRNFYIRAAELNGRPLNQNHLARSAVVNGGVLKLDLDSKPNHSWGLRD